MLTTADSTLSADAEDAGATADSTVAFKAASIAFRSSRKVFSGKIHGERRSRRRGTSVDFADYRPYSPGDDLRFVDWNIYARLDALFLKLFLEEEDLSLGIAIDTSASMDWGNPNKLTYCRRLAMECELLGRPCARAAAASPVVSARAVAPEEKSLRRSLRGRRSGARSGSSIGCGTGRST